MPKTLKMMSERQAWLYLAKKWDKPVVRDDGCCYISVVMTHGCWFGICAAASELLLTRRITHKTLYEMQDRLEVHRVRYNLHSFFYPFTRKGARQRAKLCRKFAENCTK